MNNNAVNIQVGKCTYPVENFNPNCCFPEYIFDESEISPDNRVYSLIRDSLHAFHLDDENYGTPYWNPLKDYIKPGNTVLIKPNWVMHYNKNKKVKKDAMECLITHPSCIRAICDYCLIALQGKGRVIIGDAPMQDCVYKEMLEKSKYNVLLAFYKEKGQPVEYVDFRQLQSTFHHGVIVGKTFGNGIPIEVNMSEHSQFLKSRSNNYDYQVDNYKKEVTQHYHNDVQHIYSVNQIVLQADTIINFCKPKTHRLSGLTAALKNSVGIIFNKASLPHRTAGSKLDNGDAYLNQSRLKKFMDLILNKKIELEDKHHIWLAYAIFGLYGVLYYSSRTFCKDSYFRGCWYGNDTIWRTVIDLNYILNYADKTGKVCDISQRKILNFADMIVSGEHQGPCAPEPKYINAIIVAEDAAAMDATICKLMGFDARKILMMNAVINNDTFYKFDEVKVTSNLKSINGNLNEITFPDEWRFIAHDNWKGHIEI